MPPVSVGTPQLSTADVLYAFTVKITALGTIPGYELITSVHDELPAYVLVLT